MRAVEEESKKVEVPPAKLPTNNESEVCPYQHSFNLFSILYSIKHADAWLQSYFFYYALCRRKFY